VRKSLPVFRVDREETGSIKKKLDVPFKYAHKGRVIWETRSLQNA